MVCFSIYLALWVPEPLPESAPVNVFSEGRALSHVRALAEDIGERQVSTPGVELGAQYVQQQAEEIPYLACARNDITIEVERQDVSGAVNFAFVNRNMTNVYHNVTNIAVRLTPTSPSTRSSLLINAHFDSTLGTVGASDCASCVGVAMEALRTLACDPSVHLEAPVVFLFNGGEETLMQAAHGFMASNPWAKDLGAFVNLESTGPYGLPVMFQHESAWAASTYARSAKYPRGTALAQDFFDSGLIPADTDFKMFASRHQGSLPGVDIAYVLGGSAYHTSQDKVDRIRPGTMQELGETVLGLVKGFTDELAMRANGTSMENDEPSAYYFDLGWTMVCYPRSMGMLIHSTPLFFLFSFPGHASTIASKAHNPAAVGAPTYGSMFAGLASYVNGVLLTVTLPGMVGVGRVLLGGSPLIFFAHHWLAYLMFVPVALIGAMTPFVRTPTAELSSSALGAALWWAALGLVATHRQLGFAIYPFLWTIPVPASQLFTLKGSKFSKLLALTLSSFIAVLVGTSSSWTLAEHVLDKLTLTGSHGGIMGHALADGIAGAVVGAGVWLSLGTLGPALAVGMRPVGATVMKLLLGVSLGAALIGSLVLGPYSEHHPKRVFVSHLHLVDDATEAVDSYWVAATTDTNPMSALMAPQYLAQAVPAAEEHSRYLYPLASILDGLLIPAPGPNPAVIEGVPTMQLTSRETHSRGRSERLHLHLNSIKPCWAKLNITSDAGSLTAWSFTDAVTSVPLHGAKNGLKRRLEGPGDGLMHIVRYAGNGGAQELDFWLDFEGADQGGSVRIETSMMYLLPSEPVAEFAAQFPDWAAVAAATNYHRDFTFELTALGAAGNAGDGQADTGGSAQGEQVETEANAQPEEVAPAAEETAAQSEL